MNIFIFIADIYKYLSPELFFDESMSNQIRQAPDRLLIHFKHEEPSNTFRELC